jgi:hypothetical protein
MRSPTKYTLAEGIREQAQKRVRDLLGKFVLYPQLDLAFLQKYFS